MEIVGIFVILAFILIVIFLTPINPGGVRQSDSPPNPPTSPQQRIEELEAQAERLRASGRKIIAQRDEWKGRALSAEAKLTEAAIKGNNEHGNDGADRYAALKRYLAKQFHPDNAPGPGIEKIVRSEIFKEIWSEIDRLDHQS